MGICEILGDCIPTIHNHTRSDDVLDIKVLNKFYIATILDWLAAVQQEELDGHGLKVVYGQE